MIDDAGPGDDRLEVARADLRLQHRHSSPQVLAANREGRLHPDQRRSLLREGYGFGGLLAGLGVVDTVVVLVPFPLTPLTGTLAAVLGAGPVLIGGWLARWYRRHLDDPVSVLSGRLAGRRADSRTVHAHLGEHFVAASEAAVGVHVEVAVWHRKVVAAAVADEP